MKKIIFAFLLILSGVVQAQTYIKLNQLQKSSPVGSGSVIVTDNTGTPTYSTISAITGSFLPINNPAYTGSLTTGTPSYTDINIWSMFQGSNNNYYQAIWQNTNAGNKASVDLVVSNNLGTATSYYGNFGMNSSTFTGTTIFNKPNVVYLTSVNSDLAIGTLSNNSTYFLSNGNQLKYDSLGNLGLGIAPFSNTSFRNNKTANGNVNYVANYTDPVIGSSVTTGYTAYNSTPTMSNTAFTLTNLYHFNVAGPTGLGSATLTNQYGYYWGSGLTGATNNYGVYGQTAAGTNRWNIYMQGTAQNYFAGAVGIGTTTPVVPLHVIGSGHFTSGISIGSNTLTPLVTKLQIIGNSTGSTAYYNIYNSCTTFSDVTTSSFAYYSSQSTDAKTFTLTSLTDYFADQGAKGAGSTITNRTGFDCFPLSIGTNNYSFRGRTNSGTNNYNLYMSGTAQNYLNGNLGIFTTAPLYPLHVTGNGYITTKLSVGSSTTTASRELDLHNTTGSATGQAWSEDATSLAGLYAQGSNATYYAGLNHFGSAISFSTGLRQNNTAMLDLTSPFSVIVNPVATSTLVLGIGGINAANEAVRITTTGISISNFLTTKITVPTAQLHLSAGTTTASTAPLKFTSGSLLTTAEAGAEEFLTDAFYGTITTGAVRRRFTQSIDNTLGTLGTSTNDNASAGNVGQSVIALLAVGSATTFTTTTAVNVLTISLTAGDWDVEANLNFNETTSTVTSRKASISIVSATQSSDGSECYNGVQSTVTSEINTITLPNKRISIAGTTTVYLVGTAVFSAGTCTGFGTLTARRVR